MANESVTVLEDGSGHRKNWILASGEVSEVLEEKVRLILPPYKEAVWQMSHLPFVASHAYFLKMCLCPFKCIIFNVKWFCVFFNSIKETCMYFLLVSVFVHVTSLSTFLKKKTDWIIFVYHYAFCSLWIIFHLIPKSFSVLTSIFPISSMTTISVPPFPEVLFLCVQNIMYSNSNL